MVLAATGAAIVFYTPAVCCSLRELRDDIGRLTVRLHACVSEHLCGERAIGTDQDKKFVLIVRVETSSHTAR